ncbi:HAD family hydrolase, partial [Candidatus Poribacteria bacterium]|nr:HAD family hydrolase [Candidatus Poribacteria bacterium]
EPLQKRAFEVVCRRHAATGVRITEEMHAGFVGKSDVENARELIDAFGIPVSAEELVAEREDAYVDVLQSTRVPPMDGVRGLIEAGLAAGMKLAVASSSIRRFVDVSLARMFTSMAHGSLDVAVFSTIVCGDDPEIAARKPAPDIYLRAAERVGFDPSECMALEDSGSGVSSALAAGISRTIAVPNIYTHGHDFSGAYAVLASVADVSTLDFFPKPRASS